MVFPFFISWVEKQHNLFAEESGEVCSFKKVAIGTAVGEIFHHGFPAVFDGSDVVNMKWKGKAQIRNLAIFTD